MATAQVEGRQEGSRWINVPPDAHDLAYWFKENARLHPDLDPAHYVGGVQLISQTEKVKVARQLDGGAIAFPEVEQLVYTPYIKIDTRVRYFWDLCELNGWRGSIEPAPIPRVNGDGVYNENLGAGFFRYPVKRRPSGREEVVHYIGRSMQVRAYLPDGRSGGKGRTVLEGPPATKVVPMLFRSGFEDPNAPLKAETGAIGRALGMCGMLVIPGTGIATAEDMADILGKTGSGAVPEDDATLPDVAAPPAADVKTLITERIVELESLSPEATERVQAWARERKLNLDSLTEQQERTVLRKLDQELKNLGAKAEG